MKKIMTIMMVAILGIVMASCTGKSASAEDVAAKVTSGQTLSEADYTVMIDYCIDYAKKAQPYFNVLNSGDATDSKAYTNAVNELANMASSAVYLDTFRKALDNADAAQLGEKNVQRLAEFANLEAMPIADISDSSMLNPDVVGDVVDMPSSDSSKVIATGAGEVVKAN
ncbi:MAG: hypothetical protein HDS62_10235 [Bacteroidales bacterium]|nr:hypothetical protein [Bacteroidales bacterium]